MGQRGPGWSETSQDAMDSQVVASIRIPAQRGVHKKVQACECSNLNISFIQIFVEGTNTFGYPFVSDFIFTYIFFDKVQVDFN